MTTILTLAIDPAAQAWFEEQRQAHFPPALNHIPAHLSLFHNLPGTAETRGVLQRAAAAQQPFHLTLDGVRSMGRGVTYTLSSPELLGLHRRLSGEFSPYLIPQDKQPLHPHIVVQNKVEPAEAKLLLAQLQAGFARRIVPATGLLWWEYRGGPWRKLNEFDFGTGSES